jgi:molybdopterin/thiamine biosynthesis adenylyltransferase
MAFAKFYDKAALSAAQILNGVTHDVFLARMQAARVVLVFGRDAVETHEGRVAVELSANLLARLLPSIGIKTVGEGCSEFQQKIEALVKEINPLIELTDATQGADIALHVGGHADSIEAATHIFIGSDGWRALLSRTASKHCGTTRLPFGAAAAACFGCANVFRSIFSDVLPGAEMDTEIDLSLRSYNNLNSASPDNLDLGELFLAGVGAIGNGLLWTLAQLPEATGTVHVVDGEKIDIGNLQRYVLTRDGSIGIAKVDLAVGQFTESRMNVIPHEQSWGKYLAERGNYTMETVLVALDTGGHRITVQGSLPRRILNAWTQQQNLGVSRHANFLEAACLACLYIPDGAVPDDDDIVAAALRITDQNEIMQIRHLLYSGAPLPPEFISMVETRLGLEGGALAQFAGKSLRSFYSGAVCGGLTISSQNTAAEVPMPFQSALAGVMLAAELVSGCNTKSTTTSINLLRPLAEYLSFPRAKHPRCICSDPVFQNQYRQKMGVGGAGGYCSHLVVDAFTPRSIRFC